MKNYAVSLSAKALDWLEDCRDAKIKRRITEAIDVLETNSRPVGCLKLTGEKDTWRICMGNYRILYEVHDDLLVVLVIRIADRKEVYR